MFKLPFFNFGHPHTIKPVVLIILDGFGLAPPSSGNAISLARTPHWDSYLKHYPNGALIASGESVGLPTNEVGNTEVGHLTLGAGRVIFQDLKRINIAIEKGTFYDNKALVAAAAHAKKNNSNFHIMGLVSTGKVHSSIEHLNALIQFCKKEDLHNVYIHAFTDGRDAAPKDGIDVIKKLEEYLDTVRVGKIASLGGRYYAMDRDRRWQRTEKMYKAIVEGVGNTAPSAQSAIENAYSKGQTDEFIEPTIISGSNGPLPRIGDNDAAVFFNYRIDRAKQLSMAFVLPDFEKPGSIELGYDEKTNKHSGQGLSGTTFTRGKKAKNLFFVTMTEYQKGMPVSAVAYAPEMVANPLPCVLSGLNLNQLHMAESEKERFVTYYFDGMREEKYPGEETIVVPSPKVATYDLKPEMSLPELSKQCVKNLQKDMYHFVVVNFANADMVAHTGNLAAAIRAIDAIDTYIDDIVKAVLKYNGTVIVTADHGNAEELLTFPNSTFFYTTAVGSVSTDHSNNPVPVLFLNKALYDVKVPVENGQLCDVAPTILHLMGINTPAEMTGRNLLERVKIS